MFKFFFKPQYSIYDYIGITLVVSLMMSNMWITAILSVVSVKAIVFKHYIDEYTKQETTKLTHVKTGIYI